MSGIRTKSCSRQKRGSCRSLSGGIWIDNARRKQTLRRGGTPERVNLSDIELSAPMPSEELITLDAALKKFAEVEPEKAELVKLKFFAGLKTVDVAKLLDISEATAKRYWAFSRAWLFRELKRGG